MRIYFALKSSHGHKVLRRTIIKLLKVTFYWRLHSHRVKTADSVTIKILKSREIWETRAPPHHTFPAFLNLSRQNVLYFIYRGLVIFEKWTLINLMKSRQHLEPDDSAKFKISLNNDEWFNPTKSLTRLTHISADVLQKKNYKDRELYSE